jgi:O-antigen ligase
MTASATTFQPPFGATSRTAGESRAWTPHLVVGVSLAVVYLLVLGAGLDQVAIGVVALGALVSVVSPAAGLSMFVLMMSMREPDLLVPIRFNAVMAGAIALGCVLRLPRDRLPRRIHPGLVLLVGYLAFSALSIPPVLTGHPVDWSPSILNFWLRLATGVVTFLSAAYVFRRLRPEPIIVLLLIGATIVALLAFSDIAGFLPLPALTHGLVDDTGSLRASGTFADPNFLGEYMVTATIFALGVLMVVARRLKLVMLPLVALLFLVTALTYSRGAYFALGVGVVVLVALRNYLAALPLLLVLGLVAAILYPAFLEARQGGLLSPGDLYDMTQSEDSRATLVAAGLSVFAAFPIFGVGFGAFPFVSPGYFRGGAPDSSYSHNQYVNILAEQGVVGALLVAILIVSAGVAVFRSRSPFRDATLATGAAFLADSVFLHTMTVFQSVGLIWVVLAATLVPGPDRTDQVMES